MKSRHVLFTNFTTPNRLASRQTVDHTHTAIPISQHASHPNIVADATPGRWLQAGLVKLPMLVVHGTQDEIVPYSHGKELVTTLQVRVLTQCDWAAAAARSCARGPAAAPMHVPCSAEPASLHCCCCPTPAPAPAPPAPPPPHCCRPPLLICTPASPSPASPPSPCSSCPPSCCCPPRWKRALTAGRACPAQLAASFVVGIVLDPPFGRSLGGWNACGNFKTTSC